MSETAAKKDIQKLQRVIVDALEDVKAQDIQVFNTEHLSPLFERVIIASGTSNRQTKALSASVRDKVREGGFGKPRIEGEDNGEWIIADCGAAVVHIMQPVIRQYYNLEEIWGDKPVRLKFGAPKPLAQPARTRGAERKTQAKTPARSPVAKPAPKAALKAPAKKAPANKAPASKAPTKKSPATKTAARKASAKTAAPTQVVVGKPKPKPKARPAAGRVTTPRKPARPAARKSA